MRPQTVVANGYAKGTKLSCMPRITRTIQHVPELRQLPQRQREYQRRAGHARRRRIVHGNKRGNMRSDEECRIAPPYFGLDGLYSTAGLHCRGHCRSEENRKRRGAEEGSAAAQMPAAYDGAPYELFERRVPQLRRPASSLV
jgi:hypothetical protein